MRRFSFLWLGVLVLGLASGCAVAQKKEQQAEVHYILGISYLKEEDPTRALKEFLQAASYDPENTDVQAALGQTYQLKQAYPEAEKYYLRALELSGGDPQIQNNLAALYLDMRRWDDAIRYFRSASENLLFTSQAVALAGMGYAHAQKGEYLEAVDAYQKALAQNPRYVQAQLLLGDAYYALDRADLAVEAYRRTLERVPGSAAVHYKLALARMKQGERKEAAESFREVLRLAPEGDLARQAAENLKVLSSP